MLVRILVLVVLGPAMAVAVTWAAARTTGPVQLALWAAVASSVLILAPAFHWAVDHERTRVTELGLVGAACGALPPLLALVSSMIGLFLASSMSFRYVRWVLGYGASLPVHGLVLWPDFLRLVALSVLIGAATGTIFGLLFGGSPRGRVAVRALAAVAVLASAMGIATLFRAL